MNVNSDLFLGDGEGLNGEICSCKMVYQQGASDIVSIPNIYISVVFPRL